MSASQNFGLSNTEASRYYDVNIFQFTDFSQNNSQSFRKKPGIPTTITGEYYILNNLDSRQRAVPAGDEEEAVGGVRGACV